MTSTRPTVRDSRWGTLTLLSVACATLIILSSRPAVAASSQRCSQTSSAMRQACWHEIQDDFWTAVANCQNLPSLADRSECRQTAREVRREAGEECGDVFAARQDVCDLIGQEAYDPDFSPANFVDPDEIGITVAPNPYFPLVPGAEWRYKKGDETVVVVVSNKTKLIEGVTCRVVVDTVRVDGVVKEDTDDWYAQHQNGDVWYCGEEVKDFETFVGDKPEEPELVAIDGSFKAGRDSAKPGLFMLANPQVGDAYRQEMSLGEAEDYAQVISITGTESVPAASCTNNCLVTREGQPTEPGITEDKYYVPGVGPILEVSMDGSRLELIEFSIP